MDAASDTWRPLGRLLVEQGLLGEAELERALAVQAETGRPLGRTLVELGLVSSPALSRALVAQHGTELTAENGFGTGLWSAIERRHGERPTPEPEPEPEGVPGHVVFAELAGRYALLERAGDPPAPGARFAAPELDHVTLVAELVGASPFPGDARPCVFARRA